MSRVRPASPLQPVSLAAAVPHLFTLLSYQIVAVTVGWHIYELTRDPRSLG